MAAVLINQYLAVDDGTAYARDLAGQVISRDLSLLQFIQHLGDAITSDHANIRTKAVELLAEVLTELQAREGDTPKVVVLTKQDIGVLVDFLAMKFDDPPCVAAVLLLLTSLVQCGQFMPGVAGATILKALTSTYQPRSHLARVRFLAFQLLKQLLESHPKFYLVDAPPLAPAHARQLTFTRAFITIAEGEKDPRNLLQSFALNVRVNRSFTFDPETSDDDRAAVNDLFDVCFCYFPISFTPPPNDPYKITLAQLKQELTAALLLQPAFADEAIVALTEKLTSTNPVIRNDVLATVLACVRAYGLRVAWLTVWNALKFELLHRHDNTQAVFSPTEWLVVPPGYAELVEDSDPNKSLFYAVDIISLVFESADDAAHIEFLNLVLSDVDPMMAKISDKTVPAAVILVQLASVGSAGDAETVVEYILRHWGKYLGADTAGDHEVLDLTRQRTMVALIGFVLNIPASALGPIKPYLVVYLQQLLGVDLLREPVLQQLLRMVQVPNLLNPTEVKLVFEAVNAHLTSNTMKTMVEVSTAAPALVIEHVLPKLVGDIDEAAAAGDDETRLTELVEMLSKVATTNQVLEVVLIRLVGLLERHKLPVLAQLAIEAMTSCFIRIQLKTQFLVQWQWHDKIVPGVLGVVSKFETDADTVAIYDGLSSLVGLLVKFTDESRHAKVLSNYQGLVPQDFNLPSLAVSLMVLANLDKGVEYTVNVDSVIKAINAPVTDVVTTYTHHVACQMLALGVNKFGAEYTLTEPSSEADLAGYIWALKGRLWRLDPAALEAYTHYLASKWCNGATLAIIFEDIPIFTRLVAAIKPRDVISKVQPLAVKPLAKQRLFEMAVATINGKTDPALLEKLAAIVERVPATVIQSHLADLLPSVITSIRSEDPALLTAGMEILAIMLADASDAETAAALLVVPHLDVIIPRLATVAVSKHPSKLRIKALHTLALLFSATGTPTLAGKVVHYKEATLATLAPALDDKRRTVRKTTADVRQLLFEL